MPSERRKRSPSREDALLAIALLIGGAALAVAALVGVPTLWMLAGLALNAAWVTGRYLRASAREQAP